MIWTQFRRVFKDRAADLRVSIIGIYLILFAMNLAAWAWAFAAFYSHPVLLGTSLLAYSFGLRHAVDADHIAAIDNVTRKLMNDGKRPVSVGFFFSLGHSTVVLLACFAVALTTSALQNRFGPLQRLGGIIGTSVSAGVLFALAVMNILIMTRIWQTFQRVRHGGRYVDEDMDIILARGGLLARVFRPLFRLITKSRHMYPLGFLFGLGFETATEVALVGLSASETAKNLPIWSVLVFPALFTAGMSLVDTTDGILMLGAYGWAFLNPLRKLFYNLTVTAVSVLVAVLIGGVETLGLIGDQLSFTGWFWDIVRSANDNFGVIGYLIIGLFVASWFLSLIIYRIKGYDKVVVTN